MNLKSYLLSIPTLLLVSNAIAQDKIYKRNGDVVEVKVKEVNARTVSYKRTDNPDGPLYTINKSDLERIEYQNGTEEELDEMDARKETKHAMPGKKEKSNVHYGNNILALSPIVVNNDGFGIGLSYERVLGKKGIASFYLPFAWTFNPDNSNYYAGNYPYYNNYNGGYNNSTYSTINVMPGVKFYPTGNRGKVRYSVGPNFLFTYGTEPGYYYGPVYDNQGNIISYPYSGAVERLRMGMSITNSLNMYPTPHLYLGVELNLGFIYYDETNGSSGYYYNNGINEDQPYGQFAFKIGYRF